MSKLNPANTEYGQAAQELDSMHLAQWERRPHSDAPIHKAIRLLNQRHMELLADQATPSELGDLIQWLEGYASFGDPFAQPSQMLNKACMFLRAYQKGDK